MAKYPEHIQDKLEKMGLEAPNGQKPEKKNWYVSVERRFYQVGEVVVKATSEGEALRKAEDQLRDGGFSPEDVDWEELRIDNDYIEAFAAHEEVT
jgi:hypothetical protein